MVLRRRGDVLARERVFLWVPGFWRECRLRVRIVSCCSSATWSCSGARGSLPLGTEFCREGYLRCAYSFLVLFSDGKLCWRERESSSAYLVLRRRLSPCAYYAMSFFRDRESLCCWGDCGEVCPRLCAMASIPSAAEGRFSAECCRKRGGLPLALRPLLAFFPAHIQQNIFYRFTSCMGRCFELFFLSV